MKIEDLIFVAFWYEDTIAATQTCWLIGLVIFFVENMYGGRPADKKPFHRWFCRDHLLSIWCDFPTSQHLCQYLIGHLSNCRILFYHPQ